jgi:ATP-dependent RNA helicase DDX56/DBP9
VQGTAGLAQQDMEDESHKAISVFQRLKPVHLSTLRYRAQDVLRSLTKAVVREARAKDLKMEILNSTRLQVCSAYHL